MPFFLPIWPAHQATTQRASVARLNRVCILLTNSDDLCPNSLQPSSMPSRQPEIVYRLPMLYPTLVPTVTTATSENMQAINGKHTSHGNSPAWGNQRPVTSFYEIYSVHQARLHMVITSGLVPGSTLTFNRSSNRLHTKVCEHHKVEMLMVML